MSIRLGTYMTAWMVATFVIIGGCERTKSVPATDADAGIEDVTANPAVVGATAQVAAKPAAPDDGSIADAPLVIQRKPNFSVKRLSELDKVELEVRPRWENIQSLLLEFRSEFDGQEGLKQKRNTLARYESLKRDGKTLSRFQSKANIFVNREAGRKDDKILTGQNILRVYDGEYVYTLQEMHKARVARKQIFNAAKMQAVGGRRLFRQLRAFPHVKRLPDETLDGRVAYVFSVENRAQTLQSRYFIDQDSGVLIRMESENTERQYTLEMNVTKLELNVTFPEDHFTFILPDGVELTDETQSDSSAASGSPAP